MAETDRGGGRPPAPDGEPAQKVLAGRYELDSVLGQGGMAEVYLGTDQVLGRRVAVKVLGHQFARDTAFVTRFRREAQAAASLNHPNVVSVFDTGSDDGTHFIVMEYVKGKTLSSVIRDDAPLMPERAVEIAESVAHALSFAHKAGIVHRDVKPGNIMLTPTGDVKVMDFGIARANTSETLTQTATVLGTATYFSPEQAQGEGVDPRSDIYSLGVVMYEMLTAHAPFSGESAVAIAYKHVKEAPVPPSRLNPDVPPDLEAIVMKCLAKNPANRYQTSEELIADLHRFRSGQRVAATPLLPWDTTEVAERATRPTTVLPSQTTEETRRRRRLVAGIILAGLLAILGLGVFFLAKALTGSPALVAVPDVRGRLLPVAEQILTQNGFQRGTITRVPDPSAADTVVDYNPRRAAQGSAINLVVSSGPQQVQVPRVICESKRQALADLKAAGLRAEIGPNAQSNVCPTPGFVADQDPPPGQKVDAGSVVTLFLVPPASPSPSPTTPSPPPTTPSPTPTPPSPSPSASATHN